MTYQYVSLAVYVIVYISNYLLKFYQTVLKIYRRLRGIENSFLVQIHAFLPLIAALKQCTDAWIPSLYRLMNFFLAHIRGFLPCTHSWITSLYRCMNSFIIQMYEVLPCIDACIPILYRFMSLFLYRALCCVWKCL